MFYLLGSLQLHDCWWLYPGPSYCVCIRFEYGRWCIVCNLLHGELTAWIKMTSSVHYVTRTCIISITHDSRYCQGRIQDLPREARARNGVSGQSPNGVQGQRRSPWSWKFFVHFRTKRGSKVKDINEPNYAGSEADCFAQYFWSMGAPGSPIPGSANDYCVYIRYAPYPTLLTASVSIYWLIVHLCICTAHRYLRDALP